MRTTLVIAFALFGAAATATACYPPGALVVARVDVARIRVQHFSTLGVLPLLAYVYRGVYPADMPTSRAPAVHRAPEIMSGTPVFVGTRVPER
jgi:hypothetical protein